MNFLKRTKNAATLFKNEQRKLSENIFIIFRKLASNRRQNTIFPQQTAVSCARAAGGQQTNWS